MKNQQDLDLTAYDVELILSAVELCLEITETPTHWQDAAISLKIKLQNKIENISSNEIELMLNSILFMKSLTNKQKATAKKGTKQLKYVKKISTDLDRVLKILNSKISKALNELP